MMNIEKEMLFANLSKIQEEAVVSVLIQQEKYHNIEEMLTDVSYEVLYRCMELLDGYYCPDIKYRLTNVKTDAEVNESLDLHDFCPDYLKFVDK